MKKLRTYFITGLLVVTPGVLTVFLIWWLFNLIDGILGGFLNFILVDLFGFEQMIEPIRGLGFVAILLLIFFTGMFARNYFGKKFIRLGEWILKSIPFVNIVYNTIKQISNAFISEKREVFTKVVLFEYPRKGVYRIGFLTRSSSGEVKEKFQDEMVGVFVPSTPNPTSGFLLFVPKNEVIDLDMSIEDSLKLVISGGAILPETVTELTKLDENKKVIEKKN